MPGVLQEETPGLAGCIKWLPHKDKLANADSGIEEGCYNHPVVVLPTKVSENGKVEVLIITSFGGSDLGTKFPYQTSLRQEHLPIAPSEAHPDNGMQLTLRDPLREMRKRSYVKTKSRHRVLFSSLRPYDRQGPDYFLSRRSFDVLVEHAQLSEYSLLLLLPSSSPSTVRAPPPSRAVESSGRRSLDNEHAPILQWGQPLSYNTTPRAVEHDDTLRYQIRVQTPSQARSAYDAESGSSRYGRHQQQQSERQRLLNAARRHEELLRLYGQRNSTTATATTILPTSYRVRASDTHSYSHSHDREPSGWKTFWKVVKVLLWICTFLAVSYGTYHAGAWVVRLVARMVKWINDTVVSMSDKASSLWLAFRKSAGLA